jgi:hypothetical protein
VAGVVSPRSAQSLGRGVVAGVVPATTLWHHTPLLDSFGLSWLTLGLAIQLFRLLARWGASFLAFAVVSIVRAWDAFWRKRAVTGRYRR